MKTFIQHCFGTFRGLVRAALGYAELASGRLMQFRLRDPQCVQRVVFVCHGNICRSAFAHMVAKRLGMRVASLGLSIATGRGSPPPARASARRLGIDMDHHKTTSWSDFTVCPGDLFLVMEVRQAHEMRRRLGDRDDVRIALLGMWGQPMMPHLHDPFSLCDAYFDTCFRRIEVAVERLAAALPHVRVPSTAPSPA